MRYGPERRALSELAAEAQDSLDFEVKSARGTAEGIVAALDKVAPETKKTYKQAGEDLDANYDTVKAGGGLTGLFAQAGAREEAQAKSNLATSKAADLADLGEQKVRAKAGAQFATQAAFGNYRESKGKIDRQKTGLAGDEAAFKLSTFEELEKGEDEYALELGRYRTAKKAEARQNRATEADITGIDPATGQPTAAERDRRHDNAVQDDKARGGGKTPRGAITRHQDIVEGIQDAREGAKDLRSQGSTWSETKGILKGPYDKKNKDGTEYGGHGPLVTKAAVELERDGKLSTSTTRALKARGLLPKRLPRSWRSESLVDTGRRGIDAYY